MAIKPGTRRTARSRAGARLTRSRAGSSAESRDARSRFLEEHVGRADRGGRTLGISPRSGLAFLPRQNASLSSLPAAGTPVGRRSRDTRVVVLAGELHAECAEHFLVGQQVQRLRVGQHAIEVEDYGDAGVRGSGGEDGDRRSHPELTFEAARRREPGPSDGSRAVATGNRTSR